MWSFGVLSLQFYVGQGSVRNNVITGCIFKKMTQEKGKVGFMVCTLMSALERQKQVAFCVFMVSSVHLAGSREAGEHRATV